MNRPRLFTKTLLFMVIIFGVIATATSYVSSRFLRSQLIDEYRSKAVALARSMADSDLQMILDRDAAAIQSRIDQYLDIEGVLHVLVADDHGEIVAHTFVPVVPDDIRAMVAETAREQHGKGVDPTTVLLDAEDVLHVTQPILSGMLGYIHIGMDLGLIRSYIARSVIRLQGITLIIFMTSVLLAWAFINNISRPLTRLRDYAQKVASHDFSTEIDINSNDEVGDLAQAMRSMAVDISGLITNLEGRVAQATGELQKAKEDLEVKVGERTSELQRTNTQLKIEIAERKVVGEALKKTEQKYRSIFENAVEGIFQVAHDGHFVSANPSLARIYGFDTPAEFMTVVNDPDSALHIPESQRIELFTRLSEEGEVTNFESQIRRADGKVVWISENARAVFDSRGEALYYEGSVEDITLRKEAEEQLVHQAFHDPLTGLPNRILFLDHLFMALERSRRRSGYLFAVLYLDLDRFKIINDSLGHDIGDSLLQSVAGVLVSCARNMDTVARFGGDEFAILLEEIQAPRDAIKIAKRILDEMAKPFSLDGNEVFSSTSIGIVLHTEGYERPEALLRDADTAMYRAKEMGKSRFKVFNQRMHEQALHLMELETDLRKAVDNVEFKAVYQPIISLEEMKVAGFEALIRWPHAVRGMIMPDSFIPLAEDTGLIYTIDYRVIDQVCEQIRAWKDVCPKDCLDGDNLLNFSVNISGKHFKQPMLVSQVGHILERTGLDPSMITLEITESALMENPTTAEEVLAKLKALGVGLSVDDFGTGYSSLSYLQRFPIDTVKIDRSFVAGVEVDRDSRAIVKTIISLGLSLGLKVVAEGVETEEQLQFLVESGCQLAQGYYFSRPIDPELAKHLICEERDADKLRLMDC